MNVPLPCRGEGEADASGLLLPEEVFPSDISPKTPPARPRIRSDAEEGGAAKMVRVSIGSDLTRVSPSRLRMFARSRLKLPPFVSQVNLPLLDVVTAASFIAWHAGKLVMLHNFREVRTRKSRKIGLTTEDVIVALASDSLTEVPGNKNFYLARSLGNLSFRVPHLCGRVSAQQSASPQ